MPKIDRTDTFNDLKSGDLASRVLIEAQRITNTFANSAPKGSGWKGMVSATMKVVDTAVKTAEVTNALHVLSNLPSDFYSKLEIKLKEKCRELPAYTESHDEKMITEKVDSMIKEMNIRLVSEIKEVTRQKLLNIGVTIGLNKLHRHTVGKVINGQLARSGQVIAEHNKVLQHQKQQRALQTLKMGKIHEKTTRERKNISNRLGAQSIKSLVKEDKHILQRKVANADGQTVAQLVANGASNMKLVHHDGKLYMIPQRLKDYERAMKKGEPGGLLQMIGANLHNKSKSEFWICNENGCLVRDPRAPKLPCFDDAKEHPTQRRYFIDRDPSGVIHHQKPIIKDPSGNDVVIELHQNVPGTKNQCAYQCEIFMDVFHKNHTQTDCKKSYENALQKAMQACGGSKEPAECNVKEVQKNLSQKRQDCAVALKPYRDRVKGFFRSEEFYQHADYVRGAKLEKQAERMLLKRASQEKNGMFRKQWKLRGCTITSHVGDNSVFKRRGTEPNQDTRNFANSQGYYEIPAGLATEWLVNGVTGGTPGVVLNRPGVINSSNRNGFTSLGYDAGHMLPRQSGGSGTDRNNIVPQTPETNRGSGGTFRFWRQSEKDFADQIRKSQIPGLAIYTHKQYYRKR